MRYSKTGFFALAIAVISITGCKKWDEHTEIGNQDLTQDLAQAVAGNATLSKFMQYVNQVGLDTLLRSSKTYTIWAPTDAALSTLDPSITGDVAKLRTFLLNHISNQSYFTREAQDTLRIGMLNGKYNNFFTNKFEDATITSADKFVKNGVLHVIDKSIGVLPSLWEFVNSSTSQYLQNAFIAGLNFETFDPVLATVDSISSTTGLPIYRPGTGIVIRNRFNDRVYNLADESKQFTYFVIANAGFVLEADSLKNYFKTSSTASTDSLSRWNVVKDLIVPGIYPASGLIALISKYGVRIPANAASIVETRKLSNGIVHVVNILDVVTADKFKQFIVEGEFPSGFLADRPNNTNYRVRFNPATNKDYVDIFVSGHGVTTFYSFYRLHEIPSIKYRVYGVAVNDFQTAALSQNVVVNSYVAPSTYTTLATLAYAVPLHTAAGAYNEKLLGEFTPTSYGSLEVRLTCLTTQPIVLDYLRFEPVP